MKKPLVVMLVVALVAAAFVAPAEARKRKKKKPVCQAYVPGEMGAEAETVVVKDANTEEAPLEVTVSHAMSTADFVGDESSVPVNIQVDSKAKSAGLYALWEFEPRRDFDLFLHYPTGEEAASSHGFNPLIEADVDTPFGNPSNTATNHGGESTTTSEKLVGITTPDCGGWTLNTQNWLGEEGDHTIKLWLGEATTDPLAPGETDEG